MLVLQPFAVFFFTIFAAVNLFLFIGEDKNMGQLLLDGSDATRVLAFDNITDFLWEGKFLFVHDFPVFYDIDGDIVVDKCQNVQIKGINVAFHFQNVLFPLFVAPCIFNNGNRAIQFVRLQLMLEGKAFARFDMV